MVNTIRLYVDASYAVAIMAVAGIISGFATAGITGDTLRSLQVALAMFAFTGVLLTVRLWRVTRVIERPPADAIPPEAGGRN
jgi:membrane protein implicated in regulation of membrane protease activity